MSVAVFPLGNMIIQIDGICECDCGNNVSTYTASCDSFQ